jgi:hypothetical protein
MLSQASLFDDPEETRDGAPQRVLEDVLREFHWNGNPTHVGQYSCERTRLEVPVFTNEFWTSRQRAASSLHEVSYRACFKPQLPRFFIERMTERGARVYDPFAGRGTTPLEAALLQRRPAGCDVNPLSRILVLPRLAPPSVDAVRRRLEALSPGRAHALPTDLLEFYHPDTLKDICALREYFLERDSEGKLDSVDAWIRMVAVNRLTGHSPGFFSVYTLPPNQALTVQAQRKINQERKQIPPRRDVKALILRKTATLLADVDSSIRARLHAANGEVTWHTGSAAESFGEPGSVDLVVTSPPFLDVVDYATDNWLRAWFCGIDAAAVPIAMHRKLDEWERFIGDVFWQLERLLKRGGHVAFEVGEVRRGRIKLERSVLARGVAAGLRPVGIIVNQQSFTKTANIWGVTNNSKGTNSNRIVVFRKG